jgi:hypothetical protein
MRDKGLPEHLCCDIAHFLGRLAQMHAAFKTVGERPFPSPAGVDLRFHDQLAAAQIFRRALRLGGASRRFTRRRGDAKFLQQLLGLVLVNIHPRIKRSLSL